VYLDVDGDGVYEQPAGERIVANDGGHGMIYAYGTVSLLAGEYRIAIPFKQGMGGLGMAAKWAHGVTADWNAMSYVDGVSGRFFLDLSNAGTALSLTNTVATNVTASTAQLLGRLNATQSVFAVTVYWGPTDGTNDPNAWARSRYVGTFTNVVGRSLSAPADGLTMDTDYFYAYRATNAVTNLWARPSKPFRTVGAGVQIVAPTNGAEFAYGADVTVRVAAYSPGTVSAVNLTTNGAALGAATNAGGATWVYEWFNLRSGAYALRAIAVTNGGGTMTSAAVNVTVTGSDFDLDGIPDAIDPDDDNDGMPDEYENRYPTELNQFDATDKWEDPDRDGHANYEEYIANTIPTNAASVLHVSAVANATGGTAFMLYFGTESNRVYGVDWRTNLVWGLWRNLTNGIPGTGGTVGVRTGNTPKGSFYRLNVTLP
jgi:hypothetical protein